MWQGVKGRWRQGGERGVTLIEMLVGLGILAAIGVAVMSGLGIAFRSQDIAKKQVRAENLARAQLESIRNQTYQASYAVSVPLPARYSMTINTQPFCAPQPCTLDNNIQQNSVAVSRDGQAVLTISDLKARR